MLVRLLSCVLLAPVLAAQSSPPNIVFVMVDDMGWADPGCYGGTAIPTPNMDRMAEQGMKFTQAYSGCVVCAPARSVLMTGKHMGHTSVRLNTGGVPLLDEDVTVAEVLKERNYVCGGFGKWGLGDLDTTGVPEQQGFATFFGYYHQIHAHDFLPHYLIRSGTKVRLNGNRDLVRKRGRLGPFARRSGDDGPERQFTADLIATATLDFIREHRDERFFCYAPWTPPHGEYCMPSDDPAWQQFKDRDWPMKAKIVAAYVAMVDRHLGQLLDLLDELELTDNTVVMFCSDHGADARFEGVLDSCGPLRGRKRSMHDGGLRVPLIARWPGHVAAGTTTDHICSFADILPTFAELAGATAPEGLDGISFAPTLLGQAESQRAHDYLYWEWDRYDWGKRQLAKNGRMRALREGRWKLVQKQGDAPIELYDLQTDLGETNDLAAARPELLERLQKLMDAARTDMRPQREPPMPAGRSYR